MAPNLSEEEIDDLVYLARAGEDAELDAMLRELSARDSATPAEILAAARDEPGKATCLHMAAANGHAKTVTVILSHLPIAATSSMTAAPPSATSPEQAESTSAQPVTYQKHIDVQNAFGNSALHWACLGGHLDVVKLLLSRGASPTIANDKDQIPLDLAAFNNHMHVVDHFLAQSKDLEGDNAEAGGLQSQAESLEVADGDEADSKAEMGT
ncbi:ankyrin [Xylariaceae sp. FL1019]|nr:ankyrin [Xylariaceae sp. FL1019]